MYYVIIDNFLLGRAFTNGAAHVLINISTNARRVVNILIEVSTYTTNHSFRFNLTDLLELRSCHMGTDI